MPKYVKGQSGNLNGRPKGALNKKTQEWYKFREWFMEDGIGRLRKEMAALEGKEFINTMKDLLEYFQPKLARTEMTGKDGEELKGTIVYLPKPTSNGMETSSETRNSTSE